MQEEKPIHQTDSGFPYYLIQRELGRQYRPPVMGMRTLSDVASFIFFMEPLISLIAVGEVPGRVGIITVGKALSEETLCQIEYLRMSGICLSIACVAVPRYLPTTRYIESAS